MAPRPPRPSDKRRIPEATAAAAAAAADGLLSLPPEVLYEILTRLNLRDAVRTSVLSRAWRRRWESLPVLDIDSRDGEKLLWTVDCVLSRCSGRVRRFQVFLDELSVRRLDDWLLIFSRRGGVEDLSLRPEPYKYFSLHSTVFSWRRVTSIDLFVCHIPPLPQDFEGFPNLKELTLDSVKFLEHGEYQLEQIIETSPLLERLILCEVYIDGEDVIEWEIRAPNLRHITICAEIDYGWNFAELPCLHSAVIDLWEYLGDRDFARFLTGLAQARKLEISTFYAPVNGVKILETLPCTFHNLKSLKLFTHFYELPPILLMFCFLRSAPNLEKLKIRIMLNVSFKTLIIWILKVVLLLSTNCPFFVNSYVKISGNNKEQKIEANEFLNAQWTGGMCANIQILEMIGVTWLPNEMSFMKLILSKARFLHILSVSYHEDCSVSHDDPLRELLKYERASVEAQVLFKGAVGGY